MTVDILNNRPFQPTFEAIDPSLNEVVDTSLEMAVDNLYNQAEKNIGMIIANLQIGVESKKDDEIRKALDESKVLKAQAAVLTDFLKHLEGELSNTGAKKINLANQSELVAKVNELVPHNLLEKTEWTREEAEALCKIIPRHSEQLMNQINDAMRDINQRVEDRHELLSIFRDLQKMIREMHEVFIRNQKV
jgi:hypothetical protein